MDEQKDAKKDDCCSGGGCGGGKSGCGCGGGRCCYGAKAVIGLILLLLGGGAGYMIGRCGGQKAMCPVPMYGTLPPGHPPVSQGTPQK